MAESSHGRITGRTRRPPRLGIGSWSLLLGGVLLSIRSVPSHALVNGFVGPSPASVGLLLGPHPSGQGVARCTGTLVGCETFLTAAHCFCDPSRYTGESCQPGEVGAPEPSLYVVYLQHAGIFGVTQVAVHPSFSFGLQADVALARLDAPVEGVPTAPITFQPPAGAGFSGAVVGFGATFLDGELGLKRSGVILNGSCSFPRSDEEMICWPNLLDGAIACTGDSGGPIFMDLGLGAVITGVVNGGTSCGVPGEGYATSVAAHTAWILEQAGADYLNPWCGEIPPVGAPGSSIAPFFDVLTSPSEGRNHSFEVAPDATLLRVALNGGLKFADFDLYVKSGSPPTPSDYHCAHESPVSLGFCEFANPAEGTWHALVTTKHLDELASGYQLTATTFVPEPGAASAALTALAALLGLALARLRRRP